MKRWRQRPVGSNWGDFGEDDQTGRISLITPAVRKAALAHVTEGISFCLSLPLDFPGDSTLTPTRRPPRRFAIRREHGMNFNFAWRDMTKNAHHVDVTSDDAVTLFTQYSTQWDALAHYGQFFDADGDGVAEMVYYNGYRGGVELIAPINDEEQPEARALGIQNLAETCVQGRGTLVNLNSVYGRQHIAVGYDDLMRVIEAQRVEVSTGDILCLYTGFDEVILEMNKKPKRDLLHACTGLDGSDQRLLNWITDSGIAAIAADNPGVEFLPARRLEAGPRSLMPLHAHCLFKQGIHLGELWYMKELAQWLMANKRTNFFLTAPPLRLPGSVGSPVTPVATV
jgi:kynurenine formamidase